MAEPHWTSYVAMATGVVGAIAGIAGSVLGIVSYRRTGVLRITELRLNLRQKANNLERDLSALGQLLPHAKKSRHRVAAAKGIFKSGAMQAWNSAFEADAEALTALALASAPFRGDFMGLDWAALEGKLAEIHRLQLQVEGLTDKYRDSLKADDVDRAALRASHASGGNRGSR